MEVVVAVVLCLAIQLAPVVVCWHKGKRRLAIVGLLVPLVSIIGAIRVAKPDSRWALGNYGSRRMRDAQQRFPDRRPPADWVPDAHGY